MCIRDSGSYILAAYSQQEIEEAAGFICPDRDKLFNYSGLDLLVKRYLIRTRLHEPAESVQEMYLGIALHLAMPEQKERMTWVKKFYDLLSRLEVTMATFSPTRRLVRLDLPTFGRPMTATNTEDVS